MAAVDPVTLDLNVDETLGAASRSFTAVCDALFALDGISEATAKLVDSFFMAADDGADLLIGEAGHIAALRADNVICLQLNPSDWYLELCTAIAGESELCSVTISHGWPILSVDGVATSTLTEGAGESIARVEGAA